MDTNSDETVCSDLKNRNVPCVFCLLHASKYTCPKCNANYCSVECYKSEKHLRCSESFHKSCVMEGLSDYMASPEDRHKMVETLRRMQDDDDDEYLDSDDDEDEGDLTDRMQGLDLDSDTDKIWEKLTKAEKDEFQKMISDGQLGSLIEIWNPWWNYKDNRKVKDFEEIENKSPSQMPAINKNVLPISVLLRNCKPSANIRYTVISVLYAYAYICRIYNGDHLNTPIDSAKAILELCDALKTTQTNNSVSEAIHSCLHKTDGDTSSSQISDKFKLSLVQDVISIIDGPTSAPSFDYVMAALSDLLKLWQEAIEEISKELKKIKNDEKLVSALKSKKKSFFRIEKKVEFLLSWCKSCGLDLRENLDELNLEFCALSSEMASINKTKQQFEKMWGGKRPVKKKVLIEELT